MPYSASATPLRPADGPSLHTVSSSPSPWGRFPAPSGGHPPPQAPALPKYSQQKFFREFFRLVLTILSLFFKCPLRLPWRRGIIIMPARTAWTCPHLLPVAGLERGAWPLQQDSANPATLEFLVLTPAARPAGCPSPYGRPPPPPTRGAEYGWRTRSARIVNLSGHLLWQRKAVGIVLYKTKLSPLTLL